MAKGIIFMTQVKAGFIWSGSLSSGIILKRNPSTGKWGYPSSIGMGGVGLGLTIGAQMADMIILLEDYGGISAFSRRGQLKFGADYSISVGPIGRDIDISAYLSSKGSTGALSYSQSKGMYAGIQLDGAFIIAREYDNSAFYGQDHSVDEILDCTFTLKDSARSTKIESLQECLYSFENTMLLPDITPSSEAEDEDEEEEVMRQAREKSKAIESKKEPPPKEAILDLTESGKSLLKAALEENAEPPAPKVEANLVRFTEDHLVDENAKEMRSHGIISVPKGATATLLRGNLKDGLGGKYVDYVEVVYNGKQGKVSRHVLVEISSSGPPVAPSAAAAQTPWPMEPKPKARYGTLAAV